MPKLLIIDDEPGIQHAFRKAFHPPEYETLTARTAADGMKRIALDHPDVIVLDVHLPDADGLKAFDSIKQLDARTPIILVTGHGTTELAIEAMKRGAFDYLLKPLRYEELKELIHRASESSRLMQVPAVLSDSTEVPDTSDAMVGRCPAIQEVYKQVGRVAATDATVLIRGESGTGKELVARALYQHGQRVAKPFLAINCAAIPEQLLESELFGHEKGAFTGADRKRIGKFEQCHGGTLFLDEIGEMSLLAQAKLLRVLQEQRFERVGGTETVTTNVRLIAATNADLDAMTRDGRFRTDLFFRLNVFTIDLPPLRNRVDDLDLLTDHFVARFAREFHRPVTVVPAETRAVLRSHRWPGNVRELQSVLKQSLLRMSGNVLLPDFLPPMLTGKTKPIGTESMVPVPTLEPLEWDRFVAEGFDAGSRDLYAQCLVIMERQLITRVLQRTGGNQVKAAEALGMTRGTLRIKMKALGLQAERTSGSEPDSTE